MKMHITAPQIKNLKPGLSQIVAGPAAESPALKLISDDWRNRAWDYQLLTDAKVHQFLEDEGVLLTNWKQIMERFEKGSESPAKKARSRRVKQ